MGKGQSDRLDGFCMHVSDLWDEVSTLWWFDNVHIEILYHLELAWPSFGTPCCSPSNVQGVLLALQLSVGFEEELPLGFWLTKLFCSITLRASMADAKNSQASSRGFCAQPWEGYEECYVPRLPI
ncbi:hypothetical protein ACJRO7_023571 [Eucalyptus globulus]|uniref:Uncharacterized protein n=1 Tax=Eucalyptus globulus TaxID=34317 RepID=A0ABD3K6R6_EUCGL